MTIELRSSRGFTIVEILVVIVILAIVVALITPAAENSIAAGRSAACLSNMRQISVGLVSYAADNQGNLPPVWRMYSSGPQPKLYWTSLIAPYLSLDITQQPGQKIMRCPSRPAFNPTNNANYCYGLNYGKASIPDQDGVPVGHNGDVQRLTSMRSSTFLVSDCDGRDYPAVFSASKSGDWPLTADRDGDGIPDSNPARSYSYNEVVFVHPHKTANFLLSDGSARSLTIYQWETNDGGLWGNR